MYDVSDQHMEGGETPRSELEISCMAPEIHFDYFETYLIFTWFTNDTRLTPIRPPSTYDDLMRDQRCP